MITATLAISVAVISEHVATASNWIGLYRDAHYSGLVQSLRDIQPQTCYNLMCDGVNNAISSATWLGWAAKTSDDGFPRITFFMDKDCKGTSEGYAASDDTYPSDFSTKGMDNKISSLIVYNRNLVDIDQTITFCKGSSETKALNVSPSNNITSFHTK